MHEDYPRLDIQIIGINEFGHEVGNPQITAGRDLAWLQDQDLNGDQRSDVWDEAWNVTFRDVVILDGANQQTDVFNLTVHNLADPAHYDTLHDLLVETAIRDQQPWCNPRNILDANNDGQVDVDDAQLLIDVMNDDGPHQLPALSAGTTPPAYYDCNMDGFLAPGDAIQIIDFVNSQLRSGQGEGEAIWNIGPQLFTGTELPPSPLVALNESLVETTGGEHDNSELEQRIEIPHTPHELSTKTTTRPTQALSDPTSIDALRLSPLNVDRFFGDRPLWWHDVRS